MTPQIFLFILSAVSTPLGCSPFCIPFKSSSPSLLTNSRSSAQLNNEILRPEITLGILRSDEGGDANGRIELWLDLRGTTITPNMAIELWKTEIEDGQMDHDRTGSFSKAPFSKCLISYDESQQIGSPTLFTIGARECSIEVLMAGRDGESFKSISNQPSDSTGTIVSLKLSQSTSMPILPDPLSLMDEYSNRGWVLFDTKEWKILGEEEKLGMLFPVVDLVGSGDRNGLGWTCHSKSEIIKSAMWMKCQPDASTKTLDSGIVVPDDEVTGRLVLQNDRRTKYAIIVPYDFGLLRAAMSLINDTDVSNG
ncbi:hypothetical protein HJC23_001159 [Cyclotella cryptica]|uniref:Uncharacterized protein n=1 Tax=Cyclotella cryptica TaxID=29204 RepID=A0ABD3QNV3_9STRA